jgi:hypothetical protein
MADDQETGARQGDSKPRGFFNRLVRFVVRLVLWVIGFFVVVFSGAWIWFESSSSDVMLARKAETILEEGLGRDVSIGDLSLRPGLPAKIVVRNARLANAEGTLRDDQASLSRIELRLSLRALLRGEVRIRDVVLVDPVFILEVLPDGDGRTTNLPKWTKPDTEDKDRMDLDVDSIEIRNGTFEMIDHVDDVGVVAQRINAEIDPDLKDLDDVRARLGLEIGAVRFRVAKTDFPPFHAKGRVRIERDVVWVEDFRGSGSATSLTVRGRIEHDRIDLNTTLRADLAKLREPLGLDVPLEGFVDALGKVSGPYARVDVNGSFASPDILFDVYRVTDVNGSFRRVEHGFEVVASEGTFAGGSVTARYTALTREGEPANVLEIAHENVDVQQLLGVWDLRDTGLLARGSGSLRLAWDDGNPAEGLSGSATLRPDPSLKTSAPYAAPVGGRVAYQLSGGELRLEPVSLRFSAMSPDDGAMSVDLAGTVGLETPSLDLKVDVVAPSLARLDQIWASLARAFGQEGWALLGISGHGSLRATVRGPMETPTVDMRIHADGFAFDGLELERADGRVVYDGATQELVFHDARFERGLGELVLRNRIGLAGEEIDLRLEVGMHDWPAESLLAYLELDFPVRGLATGTVVVTGVPTAGRAKFSPLEIRRGERTIKLSGEVEWTPEEKGLWFDLDVGLAHVEVETVAGVLDLGDDLPLSGEVTGTVHLEGPLTDVSGAGSILVTQGTILGEPFDRIASDLVLQSGVLRLRNLDVQMPAGFVKGDAKLDFAQDRFGYVISASEIDLEKLRGYPGLRDVLVGKAVVVSSGAGTLTDPEIALDIRVQNAVLLDVPVADPGLSLFLSLRNGQFSLKGNVGPVFAIEGSGLLDVESGAIEGEISAAVANVANLLRQFEKRSGVSAKGTANLQLTLGGSISRIEELVVDGKFDGINLTVSEQTIRNAEPVRFSMRGGLLSLDHFRLLVNDQEFTAGGSVSLVDGKVDLRAVGLVSAGLLGVAMPDLRATGDISVALDIRGTVDDPRVSGSADILGADFRIQGFPQAFRGVKSTIVLTGSRIEIDSFSARLGRGTVSAGGFLQLNGGIPSRVRVNMQGRDVDLRLSPGLTVDGNFDLVLSGNPTEQMQIKGEARLTRMQYTKDLEIGAAIVDFITARRAKVEAVAESWESRVALDVTIDAKDAIRVRNNIARLTGSANVRLLGTVAQPVLQGGGTIDEGGLLRISNIDYRIASASVAFQNPFRIDPYIDLTAEGRYQNEYDVTIIMNGTPDTLQMSVSSDPPIADLSILNVFGIATSTASGSVNTRDSVESATGTIVDASVGTLIGSRLNFADNLRLEGLTGPEPKVTLEKSISDTVRAVVTYTMNDAGDNIEVIEWRASPRFLIQATRDSTKDTTYFINAIDLSFSRRFGGQW